MGTSVAQFSGLASGVQWRDIVDQLVQVETSRSVTPITTAIDAASRQRTAWTAFQASVAGFAVAADALRSVNGFRSHTAFVPPSASSGRAVASADALPSAQPGTFGLEVVSMASARKLAGAPVTDPAAALGIAGSFTINGQAVSVAATDTLEGVRDRINALNTGAAPTRVSAGILTTSAGSSRLVLTAATTGAGGLVLGDGADGVAADLGLGTQQSRRVPSATLAVAAALGVTVPPPSTIKVNGRTVVVDLSTDSLTSIAARIRAAGAEAQLTSEVVGGGTASRLVVGGSVRAEEGNADSAAIVAALGFSAAGAGDVRQQVALGPFTSDEAGTPATASTPLTSLRRNGALGINAGDTLTATGRRADGTAFTAGITVQEGDTLGTLVTRLNSDDALAGWPRRAFAEVGVDGAIRVVDETGGDSRLTFGLSLGRPPGSEQGGAYGSTTDLGTTVVEVAGRGRTLAEGSDAQVRIDGVLVTRSANTITDAVPGLGISLLQAEPGASVQVTVRPNTDAQVAALRALAKAYNDVVTFANQQRAAGQPLERNSTLQGAIGGLTTALRTQVAGAGTFDRLAVAGVALDRNGLLQVDESQLRAALADGTNAALLMDGVGTAAKAAADRVTRVGDGTVAVQLSSLDTRMTSLSDRQTVAQRRVDALRQRYIEQYTRMETLVSQMQSQGNSVANSIRALQGTR